MNGNSFSADTAASTAKWAAGIAAGLAAGAVAYASVWPTSTLFGRCLSAPPNPAAGPPEIALTFDDGPNPRWTPLLLDLLAQHQVKATFFLVGRYALAHPELVRRVHGDGHLIGNHTWTHPNLFRTGDVATRQEITSTTDLLQSLTGEQVRFFRPPFGLRRPGTLRIARELGLIPVTWNAIGNDWKGKPTEYIVERVSRLIQSNQAKGLATNAVLHEGSHISLEADRSRSVEATETLINRYTPTHRFVTLNEWS